MELWRGTTTEKELEAKWANAEAAAVKVEKRFKHIMWKCASCNVFLPPKSFGALVDAHQFNTDMQRRVLDPGSWRTCTTCQYKRNNSTQMKQQFHCCVCLRELPRDSFDKEAIDRCKRMYGDLSCITCGEAPTRRIDRRAVLRESFICKTCGESRNASEFDGHSLRRQKLADTTYKLECLHCRPLVARHLNKSKYRCNLCHRELAISEFSVVTHTNTHT